MTSSEEQQAEFIDHPRSNYSDYGSHQDHGNTKIFEGSQQIEPEILLLCGFPSSGTDLLKNLINSQTRISISGEFPLLPSLAQKYEATVPKYLVRQAAADLCSIDIYKNFSNAKNAERLPERDYTFAKLYGELLTAEKAKWVGNKTPQNTEHISSLNHLFPKAKFILIIRDVRDVALSWSGKWGKDPLLTASKWNDRMLHGLSQLESLGAERYLLITFEELIRNTELVATRICDFLNLKFEPSMLDYHLRVEHVFDGKRNYGQPILANNSGKWRTNMSAPMIRRIEEIAYEGMRCFGYQPSQATGSIPLRRNERISGKIHDAYSILFVGNRALNRNRWNSRMRAIRLEIVKRLSKRGRALH